MKYTISMKALSDCGCHADLNYILKQSNLLVCLMSLLLCLV